MNTQKMSDIDEDAELVGIDKDTWRKFKELHKPEQMEFESITNPIDDREAFLRHKRAMSIRWFKYYKSCKNKDKKMKLIDSYNIIAHKRER